MQRKLARLDDARLLALAVTSLQDLEREYLNIASVLEDKFPASARVFIALAAEKASAAEPFSNLLQLKFNSRAALLQRYQVSGLPMRPGGWFARGNTDKMLRKQNVVLEGLRSFAEISELEMLEFATRAAGQAQDPSIADTFAAFGRALISGPTPSARLGLRYLEPKTRHLPEARRWALWRETTRSNLLAGAGASIVSFAPILAMGLIHPVWTLVVLVPGLSGAVLAGSIALIRSSPFYGTAHAALGAFLASLMAFAVSLLVAMPFYMMGAPEYAGTMAAATALAAVFLISYAYKHSNEMIPQHMATVVAGAGTLAVALGLAVGCWAMAGPEIARTAVLP